MCQEPEGRCQWSSGRSISYNIVNNNLGECASDRSTDSLFILSTLGSTATAYSALVEARTLNLVCVDLH